MSIIFIDRRKADKAKSAPNRQKLLKRIRHFVANSAPTSIGSTAVKSSNVASPVVVTKRALEEPFFAYGGGSDLQTLVIGNDKYNRGDEIPMPEDGEGGGGNQAGQGDGEDDFTVNVMPDEFYDAFFEDCELPNLDNIKFTDKLDPKPKHAGFTSTGTPSQLSLIRSIKRTIGRRRAVTVPHRAEVTTLNEELAAQLLLDESERDNERCEEIEAQIEALHRRIAALGRIDNVDLRYKQVAFKPISTVDAVLFLVMDISGSMSQEMKLVARKWFALLYAFIHKRHPGVQLRFIAHAEQPFIMEEKDFFSTRKSGGTMVSPTLIEINKIIDSQFDCSKTNIYVCHASDGDNWPDDGVEVMKVMTETGLMSKLQFFSYAEVTSSNYGMYGSSSRNTDLWDAYAKVQDKVGTSRMSLAPIARAEDCYPTFRRVFKKKGR